ncbi:MAG: tryptophan 2,3-dioxygenase family protein [bacterium]|nr:tryptophan 2,3-dioxygenase family protein [bacterium]
MEPHIEKLVEQLTEKYQRTGQDVASYLEGLLVSDYVPYWEYIHLDTLLSLQKPKTKYKDERIFIMYHQITELYFRLILDECEQITENIQSAENKAEFEMRLKRINRYFKNLTDSFDVMGQGMEQAQFLKFRMALLPASGFQSVQYRTIELFATEFNYLVHPDYRSKFNSESNLDEMYAHIYWKTGATELGSGKKTYTLQQFEEQYDNTLLATAKTMKGKSIGSIATRLFNGDADIQKQLKHFDLNVNVNWPLAHYKTAVKYLQRDPETIAATGGTNWQKYLPPRFQKRIFYPELWSTQEIEEWGKSWVEEARA